MKDLQKAMGPIPDTVGGKDIHTLRRDKKTGQELIAQQNERFIRNKLSKGKIVKPSSHAFNTPAGCGGSGKQKPLVITDENDGHDFGMGQTQLPTPMDLESSGQFKTSSAVGRRNRIRRSSLKIKYDKSVSEDKKEEASKLVAITKTHESPVKEDRITQFIEDSIAMGLNTGDAKEMMIAELGNEI